MKAHSTQVLIDAYGDSTMEGVTRLAGKIQNTPRNPPMELQRILRKKLGADKVTVWNHGVSGSTLDQLIKGSDGRHVLTFQALMERSAASIVIMNFGINDAISSDAQRFIATVDIFVGLVRKNGKIPILEEPNPVCQHVSARMNIPQIEKNVAALGVYAAENGVALVRQFDFIKGKNNWQKLLVDCIHPGEKLYAIKAARLADVVRPIAQELLR